MNGGLKHKDIDDEEDDVDSVEASTTDGKYVCTYECTYYNMCVYTYIPSSF